MALPVKKSRAPRISIVILAGGLSSRMGRDKSRIRLGRRTLLGHIRATAAKLHLPVRVLRRDAVPRCGPLGGIYTALARTRADAILFLACDMPFLTATYLRQLLKSFRQTARSSTSAKKRQSRTSLLPLPKGEGWGEGERDTLTTITFRTSPALFTFHQKLNGLPCLLHCETALPIVTRQISERQLSLQSLARALKAKTLRPARNPAQLLNLNTPEDFKAALSILRSATPLAKIALGHSSLSRTAPF